MVFLSAEPAANVVGHIGGIILEVDEAQDVDAEKFDREFRPMAATGATIVYYGTPWDDSSLLRAGGASQPRTGEAGRHPAPLPERTGPGGRVQPAMGGTSRRSSSDWARTTRSYAVRAQDGAWRRPFFGSQRAQLQGTHSRQHAARR